MGSRDFSLFPINAFMIGRTYRQPEVVFISLPQVATGLRYDCGADEDERGSNGRIESNGSDEMGWKDE